MAITKDERRAVKAADIAMNAAIAAFNTLKHSDDELVPAIAIIKRLTKKAHDKDISAACAVSQEYVEHVIDVLSKRGISTSMLDGVHRDLVRVNAKMAGDGA